MATFAELRERFSDDEHKRGKQFERVHRRPLDRPLPGRQDHLTSEGVGSSRPAA
jgi:hypothetical protein